MNSNVIMIILGALIVINFILILVIRKSNKKEPKMKKVEIEKPYIVEEEGEKTVITNNVRGNANRKVDEDKQYSDIKLEPIPKINIDNNNKNMSGGDEKEKVDNSCENVAATIEDEQGETVLEPSEVIETVIEEVVKPHAIIEFKDGENVKRVEMNSDSIIIGRDPENCKLVINNDKYLGRKHAKLIKENDNFYLEDLNSKNGTFIDEVRIEGKVKLEKDSFRVGRTILNIYGE